MPLITHFLENAKNITEIANQITTGIYHIAVNSLNTNILEVSSSHFENSKNIQKFTSNSKLSGTILPFQRFKELIKQFAENIKSSDQICAYDILSELFDFDEQIKYLQDIEYRSDDINKVKDLILDLFKSSPNVNEIEDYLHTVALKEVDVEDAICYAIPTSFKEYTPDLVTSNIEVNSLLKNTQNSGIIFVLGKLIDSIEMVKPYYRLDQAYMKILYENYKDVYLITLNDNVRKKQSFIPMDRGSLLYTLTENNHPIVVTYKSFDYNNMEIAGLFPLESDVFVYCDRSYPNTINIINEISDKIEYAIIVRYGELLVLLLKIDTYVYFFLPILAVAVHKIVKDIEQENLKIKLWDYNLNDRIKDEQIITLENGEVLEFPTSKMELLNKIINNIFQI